MAAFTSEGLWQHWNKCATKCVLLGMSYLHTTFMSTIFRVLDWR